MFSGISSLLFSGIVEDGGEEIRLVSGTVSGFSSGIVEGRRRGWGRKAIFSVFSGGFSRWLQDGFSQLFSREDGWERRREKKVEMGRGCGRGEGEEEKLKSAYGKNEFCDHRTFGLERP